MIARHISAGAALMIGAGVLYVAHLAGLLTAAHDGSGAEGGDEEEEEPGVLSSIGNAVNNISLSLSPAGLELLQGFEGFAATPYSDYKGNSIGFGHLIKAGEEFANITREQAVELLASDVAWAERAVASSVSAELTQEQFDALVSLCYNIGESAFRKSTLVRLLNAGDYQGAAAQFDRWNRAGGVVNPALVRRRAAERELFQGGIAV